MASIPTAAPRVRRETLANGLTVLLEEDHAAPVAAFYVFYRVGSRNEVAGRTGLAHWVEHLLFDGTPRFPKGELHRVVAANGGYRNGFTWTDGTAFFEALPGERISLALQLEADRMVNALFDPAEVERERTVIISERQGGENYPTRHLSEEVMAAAFKAHPYGQPVIGWKSDLERITREELFQHYRRYYHPNNAVAVAVGDFDSDEMLSRIGEHFGAIAAGEPAVPVRSVEPAQEGERRLEVRRPGGASHLLAVYHVPAANHPDIPALSVADAILSGGKALGRGGGGMGRSSRLHRALVDSGICSGAFASTGASIDPGLFYVSATIRPGADAQEVEQRAFAEVQRLAGEPVSDEELRSAIEQTAAQFAYAAEGVSRKASALGYSSLVGLPTDDTELLTRLRAVTAADVQHVCAQYLMETNRTTGWFHPSDSNGKPGKTATASAAVATGGARAAPETVSRLVAAGVPAVRTGVGKRFSIRRETLSNGIVVLVHQSPGTPWSLVRVSVPGGRAYDPEGQECTAAAQSALRLRGTTKRGYEQIAAETDRLGMQLGGGAGDYFSTYSLKSLIDHLNSGLDLLADVLRNPAYPEAHLDVVRTPLLAQAREEATNTRAVAERRFHELVYPASHPFHRWPTGTPEGINAISREDLLRFAGRFDGAAGVVVVIAGGLDPDDAVSRLERVLGGWPMVQAAPDIAVPPVDGFPSQSRDARFVPGKTQTDLVIGLPGIARDDPDYYRVLVGDTILGRLGMGGRLGTEIRERRGLAYYASTSFDAGYGPGPWAARIGVAPADVDAAVEATLQEFQRFVASPPAETELADAKQLLTGSLPLRLETADGVASTIMSIERFGLGLDYVDRYPAAVQGVTADQVQEAARQHLLLDRIVVVSAGPEPPSPQR